MSRFKASKFKNAKEKIPHIEGWITGLNLGSIQFSHGNHIKASAALMAFNIPSGNGGSLAVLPINAKGRKDVSLPSLQAHSGLVTDFDFNPFDDFQLATCSQDGLIRIWDIPGEGLTETLSTSSLTLPQQDSQVEVVSFNPCAGNVLAATTQKLLKIFDIQEGVEKIAMNGHNDTIQSISWREDGTLLASSAKDKTIRIIDPRQQTVANETSGHENPKDSRICWFGNQDYILSTGASKSRTREAFYFDVRNLKQKVSSLNFDSSSGVIIPLFDPDTNMLFLAGKGDTSVRFYDICETSPHIRDASIYLSKFQSKGAALVRKRAMDVMSCEVNRVLQLTQEGVLPITYEVPRKSHRDFQPELFPDTLGDEPGVTSEEWFSGQNGEVPRVSLNPSSSKPVVKKSSSTASPVKETDNKPQMEKAAAKPEKPSKASLAQKSTPPSSASSNHAAAANSQSKETESVQKEEQKVKKPAFLSKRFTSKFRHINVVPMHRSSHFTSVKRVSISTLSESDGFHINKKWAAVPMSGAGGNVAIIDLENPCKLPEVVPFVDHGSDMTDFAWDPFDDSRLAVTSMNCKITIWKIRGKTAEDFSAEVETELSGHNDKIYSIKFHPLAKDVIMSSSQDMTIKIWNISTGEEMISLDGHTDQIFSIAWSPDGNQVATLCKDGKIRLYEPRSSTSPVQEHNFVSGTKGARIVFVLDGSHVVVSGQNPARCLSLFKVSNLASPIHQENLGTSPTFVIPYYDEDTRVLVCTGKGDTSAQLFEVLPESPYLASLAGFSSKTPHQAFSFLPKTSCVVKDVEVMRAMRLTMATIEPITFTVPRVKKEYFQDDIFPDTRASWEPTLESGQWFNGEEAKEQGRINLNTDGMKLLSEAPKMNAPPKKYTSEEIFAMKTDQEKKDELMSAMTDKLGLNEQPLPQDEMEGVDDDEWDD